MFTLVTTVVLYVGGFVFLYGVIRLAIRHALEEAEVRRIQAQRAEELAAHRDRTLLREKGYFTGS
ncbi:hypothetical protein [Salinispora arenicola]|uniref:Uncharacterized protein n=2 Tax=Salinispora arenicola TaxID=168697 RepID=A0A542XK02_SALAC|nr:hypothetical protein [Salinispora arenicola]MCN0154321.1 hypothetical protein [Salinispora arenicola]MCN0180185.1 hypothetical protein [Salinispora arenicola]NIL42915.1 hypothetical protein [Salinispora arenicola]NIL58686.1 hypothetical protein [Salinispora arenicola]NIL63769.1 hypothetical protein [Salinispora arenicola]